MFNRTVAIGCLIVAFAGIFFQYYPLDYIIGDRAQYLLEKLKDLYGNPEKFNSKHEVKTDGSVKVFSAADLSRYTGERNSPGLYLAILGNVYDVAKGERHYGPGGGYHGFASKDGTRAFATGQFTDDGLIPDVSGLSHHDILSIQDWDAFYKKDYIYKGKVQGWYYDENGKPTKKWHEYKKLLEAAKKFKQAEADEQNLFPPCNSEWAQGKGGRLWCSNKSGGIKRDWVGVPRKLFKPATGKYRCACIRTTGPPSDQLETKQHNNRGDLDNPNLKEYDNCVPTSESCPLPES